MLAIARGRRRPALNDFDSPDLGDELLAFSGLQGMIDPPRPEAVAAVAACQDAGIAVKMITGDHAATAQAIAAQIGLHGGARGDVPAPR